MKIVCPVCGSDARQEMVVEEIAAGVYDVDARKCAHCSTVWRPAVRRIDALKKIRSNLFTGLAVSAALWASVHILSDTRQGIPARFLALFGALTLTGVLVSGLRTLWHWGRIFVDGGRELQVFTHRPPPASGTVCYVCKMSNDGRKPLRVCLTCKTVVHQACWSQPCPRCHEDMTTLES